MKKQLLLLFTLCFHLTVLGQVGNYDTINFNKLIKNGDPVGIFGWGESFNRSVDIRPNPHPTSGTMMINHHTGLTLSAHSVYGGLRFYNQGYPNTFDLSTGAKMVMSIMNGNVGINKTDPSYQLDVNGDANFQTIYFDKFVKYGDPVSIFGWGESFDRSVDIRPNPHPNHGTMVINHHTGLTLSAHSAYGGIRFYNQGYPGTFDASTGGKMVMSIMDGSVGIGTATPIAKLNVEAAAEGSNGNAFILSSPDGGQLRMGNNYNYSWLQSHANLPLRINELGNNVLLNLNGGNVGIGTSSPNEKLAVNGKVHAHEVRVDVQGFPDYVFDEGYKNLSLPEIEKYVKLNKHLPEVPSAAEVKRHGLELGEMNKLLLKKIEELTLHLIEQNKLIDKLNKKGLLAEEQKQRIDRLEKLLLKKD